ncbi:MAG: hypothetical protein GY725_06625 [bacterium]|nr:hypothetical protein [bacterium]
MISVVVITMRALFGGEFKLFVARCGGKWRSASQPQVATGKDGGEVGY